MNEEQKHQSFSAGDIQQYHLGNMPASKMHELEKAAMDDPFLAEALEGYAVPGVDPVSDIKELNVRLAKRTGDKKVIPITGSSRSFPWLRAAAIIIFLVGGGLLVYQLGFNKKSPENNIAKVEELKKEVPRPVDSDKQSITQNGADKPAANDLEKPKTFINSQKDESSDFSTNQNGSSSLVHIDSISAGLVSTEKPAGPVVSDPAKALEAREVKISPRSANDDKNKPVTQPNVSTVFQHDTKVPERKDTDQDGVTDKFSEKAAGSSESSRNNRASISYRQETQRNNLFNGRVTDLNNNPLPFANVLNISDSVGTYADARGYFNLSSPDSILNVQIRSLGYNETNLQLRNGATNNQVYLKEDLSISPRVLDQTKRNTTRRAFEPIITIEESEPADGWSNYDTYIVNNLQVPSEIKDKEGDVEISFEVTKKGEPTHFKVEKSLCAKCDEEAIRLIKEGPKWKRKGKKGRGSVTVPFSTTR